MPFLTFWETQCLLCWWVFSVVNFLVALGCKPETSSYAVTMESWNPVLLPQASSPEDSAMIVCQRTNDSALKWGRTRNLYAPELTSHHRTLQLLDKCAELLLISGMIPVFSRRLVSVRVFHCLSLDCSSHQQVCCFALWVFLRLLHSL